MQRNPRPTEGQRPPGRKVHGRDFLQDDAWPWYQSLHAPECRYVQFRAKSPTYGAVAVIRALNLFDAHAVLRYDPAYGCGTSERIVTSGRIVLIGRLCM